MKVKVTDPKHPLFKKEVEGRRIYIDIYHIGSGGPDLYEVVNGDERYRLLSNQIDEEYYCAQEVAREVERLGANVGDTVIIIKGGSGHTNVGFELDEPHLITDIHSSGHVEFDHGMASYFRPEVKIVKRMYICWVESDKAEIIENMLEEHSISIEMVGTPKNIINQVDFVMLCKDSFQVFANSLDSVCFPGETCCFDEHGTLLWKK